MAKGLVLVGLLCSWSAARADAPVLLRMAAVAPEGSAWARELHAFGRDVGEQTGGRVQMKWYLGAIAGDELAALDRVKKRQLDGLAGAIFCERISPSMWVSRVAGLLRDREQQRTFLRKLRPIIERESDQNGMVNLGAEPFGTDIVFSRAPVQSLADLRKQRFWIWELDDVLRKQLPAMGINVVPLPLETAGQAYDDGKVDGFIATPTSALAYQWGSRVHYFTELPVAMLPGCLVISHAAFDALSIEDQKGIRAAAAKFVLRFNDVGVHQDALLLNGLFEKQGMHRFNMSPAFFDEFMESAKAQRDAIGEKLVPKALLADVVRWLSEHP